MNADADYSSAIADSPIASFFAIFESEVNSATEQAEQELAGAQGDAIEGAESTGDAAGGSTNLLVSLLSGAGLTQSIAGEGVYGDGASVANSGNDPGTTYDSASDSGSGESGSGESGSGETGSGETGSGESATPADPRLEWEPFVLPDGIEFEDVSLPAQSSFDDLYQMTPSGTDSFDDVTVYESDPVVTQTPVDLGEGQKTETTKTTVTLSQQYVSADEWSVTQTLRNSYVSDEDSTDEDDVDTGIERESWNELTVTVINGTHTVVSYSAGDSFSYSNSLEWDNSASTDTADSLPDSGTSASSDGGDGALSSDPGSGSYPGSDSDPGSSSDPTSSGSTEGGDEDSLDEDTGEFNASMNSSSYMTIVFQDYLVTMPDGSQNRVISLNFGKGSNFDMNMSGGYEVGDAEGDLVDFGRVGEEDGEDPSGDSPASGTSDTRSSAATDIIELQGTNATTPDLPNAPNAGGNGHDLGTSSSFSFDEGFGESVDVSIGAMFPVDGDLDDVADDGFFGHLGSAMTANVDASGSDSLDLALQVSDGDVAEETNERAYLDLSYSQGGTVGAEFDFSLDIPFGTPPPKPDGFETASAESPIPLPPVGPQSDEVELGFGVSMKDLGDSGVSLTFDELERIDENGGNKTGFVVTGISVGNTSNFGYTFHFGLGPSESEESGDMPAGDESGEDDVSLGVSLTSNNTVSLVAGQTIYTNENWPGYIPDAEFWIEKWENEAVVNSVGSGLTVTIGINDEGEVLTEADVTFSLTSTHDSSWIQENNEVGATYNYKGVEARFYKVGTIITQLEDGTLEKKEIDEFRAESFNIGAGTHPSEPVEVDNGTTIMLDAIQDSLDYVGMVAPGIGDALDAVNVVIHLARGNQQAALISLAAAVPGIGMGVMAAKMASKAGKAARYADDAVDAIGSQMNKVDDVYDSCKNLPNCFIAGTQVVVARRTGLRPLPADRTFAQATREDSVDEKSLDAWYAGAALALGAGLTLQSNRQRIQRSRRRRRKIQPSDE